MSPRSVKNPQRGELTYVGIHARVYRTLGPAGAHDCTDCDEVAEEWSQKHECDGSQVDHYVPRCRTCHIRYDAPKLTIEIARDIRKRVGLGESQSALAREYHVNQSLVSRIVSGKHWKET